MTKADKIEYMAMLHEMLRGWVVIIYQAIKKGKPTLYDPREEGEALWSERHNLFISMGGTNLTCMIAGHTPTTDLKNGLTTVINDAKSLGIEIVTMDEFYNGLTKL